MKGWALIDKRMTMDHLGAIPLLISQDDPRPLKEQIDDNYAFGGGWRCGGFGKFAFDQATATAKYPGDCPMKPLARFLCRDETLYFYDHAIVAVVDAQGTAEFSRMD